MSPHLRELVRRLDWIVITATFTITATWTWGRWADPLIDYGREVVVPARLAQGDVLYREVEAFYGPLAPYLNAVWFRMFGPSLNTLAVDDLILTATVILLLHSLVRRIGGRLSAFVAAIVVIVVFGFSQLGRVGGFCLMAPYSHDATLGLLLALASLQAVAMHLKSGRRSWLLTAGALLGLVALTKPEPLVAAWPAVIVAIVAGSDRSWTKHVRTAFELGLMFLLPAVIAWILLRTAMPAPEATRGVLGSWWHLPNDALRELPFFKLSMGTADLSRSLQRLAEAVGWQLLLAVPLFAIAWVIPRRWGLVAAIAMFILAFVALVPWSQASEWSQMGRPLPLWMAMVCAACLHRASTSRGLERSIRADHAMRLGFSVFALFMLMKIMLNARFHHYGFVLALPATSVMIVMVLNWIPQWLNSRGRAGGAFAGGALAVILLFIESRHSITVSNLSRKDHRIQGTADSMLAMSYRGGPMQHVLDVLNELARDGDTLCALPEGAMFNHLSGLRSPVPYLTFLPPDLIMFDESRMLDALRADPPTFVLLVHRDAREYGSRWFGKDYARDIHRWIQQHYVAVDLVGDFPFQPTTAEGLLLMRLRQS